MKGITLGHPDKSIDLARQISTYSWGVGVYFNGNKIGDIWNNYGQGIQWNCVISRPDLPWAREAWNQGTRDQWRSWPSMEQAITFLVNVYREGQ
jgi:hypothetical protein